MATRDHCLAWPQVVDTDEAERKMLEEIREMCVRAGAADRRTVTEAS